MKKRKNKNRSALFIILLLIVALALIIYFAFIKKGKPTNNSNTHVDSETEKFVTLNGNTHTISYVCDIENKSEMENEKLKILFDGNEIKNFDVFVYEKEYPEIYTITNNNHQNLILKVPTYTTTYKGYYFCFLNDSGEVLGIIHWDNSTSLSYNGKLLEYEITNDGLIYYVPTWITIDNESKCNASKCHVTCIENALKTDIIEVYTNVEGAGAKK